MGEKIDIAIVGATGAVGQAMLEILAERDFPVGELHALASSRSVGESVNFKHHSLLVEEAGQFDFSKVQLALFSAGGSVSADLVPKAAAAGCVCIDNTSHFRYEKTVPLIIPEVNIAALADYPQTKIIANPNCSTIQMLVALKPLYDAVGLKRIDVATYQAVSGAGNKGLHELATQTSTILNGRGIETATFPLQIAFNAIPHIDDFQDNGYTREEMKMVWETHKILGDENIAVNPTAVRVPVFYGHGEALHIETVDHISRKQALALLNEAPGVTVFDQFKEKGYPTAVTHASGKDDVFVGRIRQDLSRPNGLNLWVVADNIRKGAALNAVQIAEHLFA